MDNPFKKVTVQPTYGDFRAIIRWEVDPKFADGTFTVTRSPDGINDWVVVQNGKGLEFSSDETLLDQGKFYERYYRVEVRKGGERFESETVGTFGKVSRQEFGAARHIMNLEYSVLRKFTEFHLCKAIVAGPVCPECSLDETEQHVSTSLCPRCYGQGVDGGYYPPVVTYGRQMTKTDVVQNDSQSGTGSNDQDRGVWRLLAFPLLRKNDLLVDLGADRRYLVDSFTPFLFGGKIPVVFMVTLTMLEKKNIRYTFPINA